ncbi:hypothetical protein KKF84_02095 [Myxococcota bacterium]|nr:hypothetical protein [Myxococcota bacterium]MBU1534078.1 hypothetical protein [Myxococcota bacterium]
MRTITALFTLAILAAPFTTARAQLSLSPRLAKAMKTELAVQPNIIMWADFKAFRRSGFFPSVKTTLQNLQGVMIKNSRCFKILTPDNVDYGLVAMHVKSHQESGYIAVNGSFSAAKLLTCVAREEKLKRTTFKGYPAYMDKKGEYFYAPSMGTFIAVKSPGQKLHPRKGHLGRGDLAHFKTTYFLLADMSKMKKGQDFKSLSGYGKIGSLLRFSGKVTFHSAKHAIKMVKNLQSVTGNAMMQPLTKTLRLKRTGSVLKVGYTMDKTQLNFLTSILGMALNRSKPAPPRPPRPNLRETR